MDYETVRHLAPAEMCTHDVSTFITKASMKPLLLLDLCLQTNLTRDKSEMPIKESKQLLFERQDQGNWSKCAAQTAIQGCCGVYL